MRRGSLALVLALAMLPLLTGSDLRSGESYHPAQYACPPDHGADPEYPECGVSGKTVAVIALGLGLLGYLFGRASAPVPPTQAAMEAAVRGVFTARMGEATRHGMTEALPLLERARDDVIVALNRL